LRTYLIEQQRKKNLLLQKQAPPAMSCGNTKQQLERAGINALAICTAPYRNATNEIINCNCPFSEHRDEVPGNYPVPVYFTELYPSQILHIYILFPFDDIHLMV